MKKYLFVVRGYFPDISASGNLLKPLVEEMSKKNFIYVLSCSSNEDEGEYSKNLLYKKIKIRVQSNFTSRVLNFLKKNLVFSFYYKEISSSIKREIERLDKYFNFDYIIAVTYEEILALMESSVNREKKMVFLLEKLPVYSTMKIPFIYNAKISFRKKMEYEIVKNFKKIFALPVMYGYFSKRLNDNDKRKLIELEHPMVTNKVSEKNSKNSLMTFIYAGGLDRKQRNPLGILGFFNKVNSQIDINVNFYSYGNMQKSLAEFSQRHDFFYSNEGISSELLNEKMADSDFILTIGNKDSELVPSKIFDCISTGKPIIHFSQIDGDPYTSYLRKYENSIIIKFADLSSQETVEEICLFMQKTKGKVIEFNKIEKNFEECTPAYVGNKIQSNL